jgi:hypothetical protein
MLEREDDLRMTLRELAMYTRSDIPDEQMSHKMREALENAEHLLEDYE